MTQKHLTEQKFTDFNLAEALQHGLRDLGFAYCTPIQAACLPAALDGKDVAGQAQTGTGKTAAFLLACCQHLLTQPPPPGRTPQQPRALILAPTRELAIQIYRDAEALARHTDISLGLVYGGTGYDQQKEMLAKGADILIGTPGRLIDFFRQGLYDLKLAQVAVLDEADRMFDLGFIRDIRFLLRRMPPAQQRLNLLFSATLSFKVMELAYEHMNNPSEIKIETDTVVVDQVNECSYYPAEDEKLPLLINLLKQDGHGRVLVFVNTRYRAEQVADTLTVNGVGNGALSGDVPQQKRERLLDAFKRGECEVLVATDVAARGLHIPAVSHVYNFDLPQDAADYIHRIGRTARAGASGEAVSFVCEKYAYSIMEIEQHIGHPLPRKPIDAELLQPIESANARPRRRPLRRESRAPNQSSSRASSNGGSNAPSRVSSNASSNESSTPPSRPSTAPDAPQPIAARAQAEDAQSNSPTSPLNSPSNASSNAPSNSPSPDAISDSDSASDAMPTDNMPDAPSPSPPPSPAPKRNIEVQVTREKFSERFGEVPAIG